MAVTKWSWQTANPSASSTGSQYAFGGATAKENQKSYQTLIEKGPVSDFSYKSWNDLCLKLKDLSNEWKTGAGLENIWVNSPYQSDYPDEETFKQNNGGVIRAAALNKVLAALPDFVEKPWNQELKAGDPCKASYFLLMAEALNQWCRLTPEEFAVLMEILFGESGNVRLGDTEAIRPEELDILLKTAVGVYASNTIFAKIMLEIIATFPDITVETHEPAPIHPSKNEFQLKASCTVIDKNYVAAETKKLEFLFRIAANAVIRNSIRAGITDSFKLTGTVNARSPSISDEMKIQLLIGYGSLVNVVQAFPVYTLISDEYKHKSRITVETHEPAPIHPSKNEFQLKASCTVIDKNYVAAETKKLEFLFRIAANAVIRNSIRAGITDSFKLTGTVNARSPSISDEMKIQLLIGYGSLVNVVQAFPVYTLISDEYKHKSRITVETHEPVPISIRGQFYHSGSVTVGFESGFELEAEDTEIKFKDNFNESGVVGKSFEYEGAFEIQSPLINLQKSYGTEFALEKELRIDGEVDSIAGTAKIIETSENLGLKGESEVDSAPPKDMQHEGDFETDETIELSFGNEKELEVVNESIAFEEGSIELLGKNSLPIEHSGSFATEEDISLGETSTKEIAGEQGITTDSAAEISKSMTLEREADAIIEMLSTADIEGVLNKNLEAETVSRISSIANLAMQRMSGLASEISVETLQEALIGFIDRKMLYATAIISTSTYAYNEKIEPKGLEGNPIAYSDSEATIVLARISLVLAEEYEEKLATEIEDISAEEMERTLLLA